MSDSSSGGYASYTTTGVGCLRGEAQKKRSWEKAMKRKMAEGYDDIDVLMARERARIGLAASKGDWPRRIAAYARDEQEDAAAYADS